MLTLCVQARATRESKVGKLLDIISHRSDDHFKWFISALVDEGNDDLAKMLNQHIAEQFIRERDASRDDRQGSVMLLRLLTAYSFESKTTKLLI